MNDTGIQAGPPPQHPAETAIQAGPPMPTPHTPPRPRPAKNWLTEALHAIASLRITVVLFVLSLLLVFYGTWAQVDKGIWTVVHEYFRSALVWIPLRVLFLQPTNTNIPGAIPYPGGWLLGGALLVNLLAAHFVRFKVYRSRSDVLGMLSRSGILLLHAGIIVMMLGELVTGLFAVEGHMSIVTGDSSNYVEHSSESELAIVDASDPKQDKVSVIPMSKLHRSGPVEDQDGQLPFDVEVIRYMVNSQVVVARGDEDNPATRGQGLQDVAKPLAEGAGVDTDQKIDVPSLYAQFKDKKTGADLGTHLFSIHLGQPDAVIVGDREYQVSLRFKRSYKPYTFHLTKFDHKVFPGTNKPKDFSSYVHMVDPSRGEDRNVRIYMNNPLRYEGETFYQSSVLKDRNDQTIGTILQVVHNPGWLMPYISCGIVSLGMLVHFGITLGRFTARLIKQQTVPVIEGGSA
jgi:ResB-like family